MPNVSSQPSAPSSIDSAHQAELPLTLEQRPLLVSGMLARRRQTWVMLIDSEQSTREKVKSVWHETLHLLIEAAGAAHDEDVIETMAGKLAAACPEISSLLRLDEHAPVCDPPPATPDDTPTFG